MAAFTHAEAWWDEVRIHHEYDNLSTMSLWGFMGLSTYEQWNRALAGRFFGPASAYSPVRIDIDEEVLGEIAGALPEAATRSFVQAVAGSVSGPGALPLAHHDEERARWGRRDRPFPPPFIGLLGLLSLAANRMRSADGYRASNYYTRLAELLEADSDTRALRLADYFRQHGDLLSQYWRRLNTWLEDSHGARGLPTAFPFGAQVHVSRAMSQALVRDADRDSLARAFLAEGLAPGENISLREMEAYIGSWAMAGRLSRSLARIAEDREALTAIADEARDVLFAWDGASPRANDDTEVEETQTKPRLVVQFVPTPARPPRWMATLVVRDDAGQLEGGYRRHMDGTPGGDVTMVRSLAPGWTEVDNRVPLPRMPHSYVLSGTYTTSSLEWKYDRPILLTWDDDLYGYAEVAHGLAHHRHIVLASFEDRDAALDLLRKHDPEAKDLGAAHQGGWILSRPFLLAEHGGDGTRIRLLGGLRLPGRNTYHVESPPDIEVEGAAGGARLIVLSPTSGDEPLVNQELDQGVGRIDGSMLTSAREGLVWVRMIGAGAARTESRLRVLAQLRLRLGSASGVRGPGEPSLGYDLRAPLVPGSLAPMPADPGVPFMRGAELRTEGPDDASPAPRCWPGLERDWILPVEHHAIGRALRRCPDCGSDVRILFTVERGGESPRTRVHGKCRPVEAGPDGLIWSSPRPAGEDDIGYLGLAGDADMDLDVLLDAMSLMGRGSMLLARRLITSMSGSGEAWIASNAVRLFESLGHLEIQRDPVTNQPTAWFVTPPTLSPLAGLQHWVLSGFRSAALIEELGATAEVLGASLFIERSDTMSTVKLTSDSPVTMETLAGRVRSSTRIPLRLSPQNLSRELVARLATRTDTAIRLPEAPPPSLTAATFEVTRGRWDEGGLAPSPLRRVSEFPRRYVLTHAGLHRYVDVRSGKYLAAAAIGVSYLRYDEESMTLSVPERAELPSLFERIAVMSSGAIPKRDGGRVRYPSVPGDVARSLGDKLGMRLERSE